MAVFVIGNYDQVRGEKVYLAYDSRLPFITEGSQGRALKTGLLALYSTSIPPNPKTSLHSQSFKAESVEGGAGRHTGKLRLSWLSCVVSGPQWVETYIS